MDHKFLGTVSFLVSRRGSNFGSLMRCRISLTLFLLVTHSSLGQQVPTTYNQNNASPIGMLSGSNISASLAAHLNDIILQAAIQDYATQHNLLASDAEADACQTDMEVAQNQQLAELESKQQTLASAMKITYANQYRYDTRREQWQEINQRLMQLKSDAKLKAAQPGIWRQIHVPVAKLVATRWKVDKALYLQYGGRVSFEGTGAIPLDAYRALLKDEEAKGFFRIFSLTKEADFWKWYTDDSLHKFYSSEDGYKLINNPVWTFDNLTHPIIH